MAFRTITGTITTTRTLANRDQLIISPAGFLAVNGRAIITDAGASVELGISGTVIGTNFGAINITDANIVEVVIDATGYLGSTGTEAVLINASTINFINAGTIQTTGTHGVRLDRDANAGSDIFFSNSGTITGAQEGVWIASGFSPAQVINSGDIFGGSRNGLRIDSALPVQVQNTGTITTQDKSGVLASFDLRMNSSGVISSVSGEGVSVFGTLNLTNSGLITGAELAIAAEINALIRNTGEIIGGVEMGIGDGRYDGRFGSVTGTVFGEEGADTLRGGSGADDFDGRTEEDLIFGGTGDDTLNGGMSDDSILGGTGEDFILGGGNNDIVRGDSGDDRIAGGANNDNIFGDTDNDFLMGDAGDDTLRGGAGDDTLDGGSGRDRLFGGAGEDRFILDSVSDSTSGAGADDVHDFVSGVDKFDLVDLVAGELDFNGTGGFSGGGDGSVRYFTTNFGAIVQIDVDGDGTRDMQMNLIATTGLVASDFFL